MDHCRWNAAWGYLWFSDLGLYYVHGRWNSPDLGRFLSPDEKGEYLYGLGDDAVNYVWVGDGGWWKLTRRLRRPRTSSPCRRAELKGS